MDFQQEPDQGPTRQTRLIVGGIAAVSGFICSALITVIVTLLTPLPWWTVELAVIGIAAAIWVVKYPRHRLHAIPHADQGSTPPSPQPPAETIVVPPVSSTPSLEPDQDDTQEIPLSPTVVDGTQTYDRNPRLAPREVYTDPDGLTHYVVRQTAVTTESWIPGKRGKAWNVTTRSVVLDKSPLVDSHLVLRSGLNPIASETRIRYLHRFDWWQWGKRPLGIVVSAAVLSVILSIKFGGPLSVYLSANCLCWLVALGFCCAAWITWGHIVFALTDQRLLLLHNPPFPFIKDQTTDKLLRLVSKFDKESSILAKTFFRDRYGTIKAGTQEQVEEDGWMHKLRYVKHYTELQLLVTEIMNDPRSTPEGRIMQSFLDNFHPERPETQP